MSIKTATDLNQAVIFLQKEMPPLNTAIGNTMSSNEFNYIVSEIETSLNSLYEKIRVAEDVGEYIKTYIEDTIQKKEQNLKELTRLAEKSADSYLTTSFVSYKVPLLYNTARVKDRDGSDIPSMEISSGELLSKRMLLQAADVDNIAVTSNEQCYNRSTDNKNTSIECQSFYVTSEPIKDGIKENYILYFKSPIMCNFCDIDSINCIVSNITLINDKDEIPIDALKNNFFEKQRATGIKFSLSCTDYKNVSYTVDSTSEKKDNFSSVSVSKKITDNGDGNSIKELVNKMDAISKETSLHDFTARYASWQKNYIKTLIRNGE